MANALTRIFDRVIGKAEGAAHPPPYVLPVTGGWLGPEGRSINWWQEGFSVRPFSTTSAMVEACVSAYSQTVAMCPGDHWRSNEKGGRTRVTNSSLSRILRQPNDYQSMSDFLLNTVRDLYMYGNAYAYCVRNNRYEIVELHPMMARMCWPNIAEDGSVFYSLSGNSIIQNRYDLWQTWIPARDVLHVRLHSNDAMYHPLLGISPLTAAMIDVATSGAVKGQQLAFFTNQARPSFVLSTDLLLDKDQVSGLRDRWNDQAAGMNAGGTPILTGGLKPVPIQMRSRDAQIAEVLKMTNQDIALVFRVPFPLLGITGSPSGSAEVLMHEWVASGLGFALNHIEESFGLVFGLDGQPDDYVEFDTEALLRSAYKDRIAALKDAVTGGIYSPNEARNKEGLPDVPYGDMPRVQQQQVPLDAAAGIPTGPSGKVPTRIPPAPSAPPQPPAAALGSTKEDAELEIARTFFREARGYDQRRLAVDS